MSGCDPLLLERMQRLRAMHGSWSKVAEAFGVTPPYISNIVNGNSPPSKVILRAIGLRREVVKTIRFVDIEGQK